MTIDLRIPRDTLAKITGSPSILVQQEVSRINRILKPYASRDVTGHAATVLRRIDDRVKRILPTIKRLECQLKGSIDKRQVGKQLRETVDKLFYDIAMDWLDLRLKRRQQLQIKLPKWFQNFCDLAKKRKGLPVLGGALRPFNLENTTGKRRLPYFKGEVVPHHGLPEKQRKGLRPDGLEWKYYF